MLELAEVRCRYGDAAVLDGVSLQVSPGEVVGFLGPNGAGKTTAMRAVFGLVTLVGGTVTWQGAPIGLAERRTFGYMPEERGLYPGMPVGEHLEYLARLHGMGVATARAAARRWAERLGIAASLGAKVESLSLGNQQRVQLAAALLHEPVLLVLDEPFSGLDPAGVADMSEILHDQAARGAAILFSSHQLDLVEHVCEAVAIVDHGRLIASGAVEELARSGPSRLAVRVGGDADGAWARGLGGLGEILEVRAGTVRIVLAEGADSQAVLELARRAGPVEHFSHELRRLSEIFAAAVAEGRGRSDR